MPTLEAELKPVCTHADVYGPNHVYLPRASAGSNRWLPRDPWLLDVLSGAQLPLAGDTPVLCSAAVATPPGLQLLRDAGLQPGTHLQTFCGDQDRITQSRELARAGHRLIVQHRYPDDELAREAYWVDPELVSDLNDKGNLANWVPVTVLPDRQVVAAEAFAEAASRISRPVVIKAATRLSTGGGCDVLPCRDASFLGQAIEMFACSERVVIEEYLAIETNYSFHFAITHAGAIEYLGCAEQIAEYPKLHFVGCWLGEAVKPPDVLTEAVLAVVDKARRAGYYGFLGIDGACLRDGKCVIYDLNFRLNATTLPMAIYPAVARRHAVTTCLSRYWRGTGDFTAMLNSARSAMRQGIFLPLGCMDPSATTYPDARPMMNGLVLGSSRAELLKSVASLREIGLE